MALRTYFMGPRLGPCEARSRMLQRAGLKVRALMAEMTIETDTATANCRKSWPLMPGMKATGTKTDNRTSVMAMIGAVIWPIAFIVASLGERFGSCSNTCSTCSTTTMASSTTMPMASTSASSDTVLAEKQEYHDDDEDERFSERLDDLVNALLDELGRVVRDLVGKILGEGLGEPLHLGVDAVCHGDGVGAGRLVDGDHGALSAVE